MRYSLFALLLLLATACTRETQTTIRFNVQDPDDTPPRVIVGSVSYTHLTLPTSLQV